MTTHYTIVDITKSPPQVANGELFLSEKEAIEYMVLTCMVSSSHTRNRTRYVIAPVVIDATIGDQYNDTILEIEKEQMVNELNNG